MKLFGYEIKKAPVPQPALPKYTQNYNRIGVQVTEDSAMTLSAVYSCVSVLARNVAALPTHLYKRLPAGGKSAVTDHPLYSCLKMRVNPEISAFAFKQFQMVCCLLWGNSYAYIVRDNAGRVAELWPLHPRYVTPKRDKNSNVVYEAAIPNTDKLIIPADNILHIPNISLDGIVGRSAIQSCSDAVALGLAAEKFSVNFYSNGANLDKVLTHPGKLSQGAYERLKEDFDSTYTGITNAHKTAILEEGTDIKLIGMPLADAQLIESRKFQIEEIARIFNVPLHLIQSQDKANSWGAGIEQQNIGFVVYSLMPWLVCSEQEYTYKLLNPLERLDMYIEFLTDALLRGTTAERYAAYAVGIQWGWLSPNDVRAKENMNPIPNGDIYRSPLNMVPLGSQPTGNGGQNEN